LTLTPTLKYSLAYTIMTSMASSLLKQVRTIPITKRRLSRAGNRYFVYLPIDLNDIWKELHEKKVEVNVIIEVPG
jgi:hypothetical protein